MPTTTASKPSNRKAKIVRPLTVITGTKTMAEGQARVRDLIAEGRLIKAKIADDLKRLEEIKATLGDAGESLRVGDEVSVDLPSDVAGVPCVIQFTQYIDLPMPIPQIARVYSAFRNDLSHYMGIKASQTKDQAETLRLLMPSTNAQQVAKDLIGAHVSYRMVRKVCL